MSYPKLLSIIAILLFGAVGIAAIFKGNKSPATKKVALTSPIEVELGREVRVVTNTPRAASAAKAKPQPKPVVQPSPVVAVEPVKEPAPPPSPVETPKAVEVQVENLPEANRVGELFNTDGPKLPIVETITYKSRVAWQKGRPAWLSDYAREYNTSRHFIARSLNGKPDYFKQDIAEGDRFNVLRKDKKIQFYLLIDLSRSKMWMYYDDLDTKDRVLLKTYQVGLGRIEGSKASGFLTPTGKYSLGNKVAIYKPGVKGYHNGDHVEMITVFGTRWIPFDKEIGECSASAKGLGIHGVPWVKGADGVPVQDRSSLGKYQSDGCIRLASDDVEEIFAIIITKPAYVEIVKDYYEAVKK
jgi:hypothetical protein